MEMLYRAVKWITVLVWKDLLLDYRNPMSVTTQLIFSIGAGVLAGVIYRSSIWPPESLIPATLSIVLVFQAIFASYNSFLREAESRTVEGLRLLPVGPEIVYISKFIYSIANIIIFTYLFQLSILFFTWPVRISITHVFIWILLASLYLGGVSSLSSAMMIYSRTRGTLAPMLILVLSIPFFQSSTEPINILAQGYMPQPGWHIPITTLGLGFLFTSTILAKYVLE